MQKYCQRDQMKDVELKQKHAKHITLGCPGTDIFDIQLYIFEAEKEIVLNKQVIGPKQITNFFETLIFSNEKIRIFKANN